jgi:hypothetical protein
MRDLTGVRKQHASVSSHPSNLLTTDELAHFNFESDEFGTDLFLESIAHCGLLSINEERTTYEGRHLVTKNKLLLVFYF